MRAGMEVVAFLALWFVLGIAVLFVAFSGGAGAARQAYLTRGNRLVRFGMPVLYVACALLVPALIIAARTESAGSSGKLASTDVTPEIQRGRELFQANCATCHTLGAAQAKGITGPNLDRIGEVSRQRVTAAIRNGGTGQDRMPRGLLEGAQAEAVGAYVSEVAGR